MTTLVSLLFTTCHPVLSADARVALTLWLLGASQGLLVPESTVARRIVGAKRTLAEGGVPVEVPRGGEL